MLTGIEIFWAFQIAVVAFVVSNYLLFEEDAILEYFGDGIVLMYNAGGFAKTVAFMVGYCAKCFGGQLAFWSYLRVHISDYECNISHEASSTVIFVCFTILFVIILETLKKWTK